MKIKVVYEPAKNSVVRDWTLVRNNNGEWTLRGGRNYLIIVEKQPKVFYSENPLVVPIGVVKMGDEWGIWVDVVSTVRVKEDEDIFKEVNLNDNERKSRTNRSRKSPKQKVSSDDGENPEE